MNYREYNSVKDFPQLQFLSKLHVFTFEYLWTFPTATGFKAWWSI